MEWCLCELQRITLFLISAQASTFLHHNPTFQISFFQASSCQSTLKPGSYLNGFVFFLMLPWWFSSKESACSAGDARDVGSVPGLGQSPGVGNATFFFFLTISDCDQGENVCLTKTHRHTHFKKPLWKSTCIIYCILWCFPLFCSFTLKMLNSTHQTNFHNLWLFIKRITPSQFRKVINK